MTSPLPPLYAAWIDDCLGGPIPDETRATCHACAMTPAAGTRSGSAFFDPGVKCCTFTPVLANFLVGAALADRDPADAAVAGRRALADRIARRIATTPLGVAPAPAEALVYDHMDRGRFGREPGLRCPYYVDASGGLCGLWKHRNGVCSTWFCKYQRGAVGSAFWQAMHAVLTTIETSLAQHCVLALDLGARALRRLVPPGGPGVAAAVGSQLDGAVDDATHRAVWGRWAGREVELYLACSELVAGLRWDAVVAIGGAGLAARVAGVRDAYRQLTGPRAADPLRIGPFDVIALDRDAIRVSTYSPHDPVEMPVELVPALRRFDGRATGEVLDEIAAEDGLELTSGLVDRLVDLRILVGDDDPLPGRHR